MIFISNFHSNVPSGAANDCQLCPEGQYCPEIGFNQTFQCDAGYICTQGAISERAEKCPIGHYCPAGRGKIKCDAGQSCTQEGLASPDEGCFPGYYCPDGSSSPKQENCPSGYYCEINSGTPEPCPAGSYQDAFNQLSAEACQPCTPGFYCPQPALNEKPENLPSNQCLEGKDHTDFIINYEILSKFYIK